MDVEYQQIHDSLRAIVPEGDVFELRLIGERRGQIDSGYFDNVASAADALVRLNGYYKGVYFTPNPVKPEALARSYNRITPWAQFTTHDPEIKRRRWLLIDIDPIRMSNTSSSQAEHDAAHVKGRTVAGMLSLNYGWPDPMINDSGNGCHLMYPMDEENSDEVRDELHTCLRTLKALYDDERTEIDITVYNAARIWRVPGTWARKGDSMPDRPHRKARIVRPPDWNNRLSILQVIRFNHANGAVLQQSNPARNVAVSGSINRTEYPADETLYKRLNEYAMRDMQWVPRFFPTARKYKEGYRIASADIGLHHEEDLTIHPWPLGIKYFGVADQGDGTEGRRTPVSVIAEFSTHTDKATAARQLSDHLNYPISEFGALELPKTEPVVMGHGGMTALLGTKPRISFKSIRTVADLQKKQFDDTKWVVKDVIPTGNMLLVARPKMRKTWLALQLGIAIASGRKFLDWECNKGDVLFLGLEDNERRIQNRIRTLQKFELFPPDLSGFRYWTGGMDYDGAGRLRVTNPDEAAATLQAFPRGEAGVDALEQYLEEYPNTSTIFIDTLAHFRGDRASRDIYQSDYESMMPITRLAARKRVLVIPVHHEKKGNADRGAGGDFLEDTSGSAGITGGSDGVISIKGRRGVQDETESRKLFITGRDVPYDYETDISFDAERGGWLKAQREDIKVAIRAHLTHHPFLNQKDLQSLMPNAGMSRLNACLLQMKLEGEVDQGRFGYSLKR